MIWINGAFGAGKSTLAQELKTRLPDALDYDPEIFTAVRAADVPLLHVFIEVPAEELRRRIVAQELFEDGRPQSDDARAFRLRNVERCVAARDQVPEGTFVIAGDRHTPAALADLVLSRLA